jgi:hypothetical protein
MNIQPIKTESVPSSPRPKPAPAAKGAGASPASDSVKPGVSEKLMEAIRNEPETRAEVVERGRALVADPDYPSAEQLGKLAELFVRDAQRSK